MVKFLKIFGNIKEYRLNIFLYFLFVILSIFFGLFAFGILSPFLDLIFLQKNNSTVINNASEVLGTLDGFKYKLNLYLKNIVDVKGSVYALGILCACIAIGILFKNLFLYLSFYVLAPIRYSISRKFTKEMYNKILSLPIGFFTEQRKGDLLSRSSNDVFELENAVTAAMESIIKEPLNIIGILIFLFAISIKLTIFVFVFLPLSGFLVGRIGRSLRKQTNQSQVKWANVLSHLEETLSSLRIIKAFNVEDKMKAVSTKNADDLFFLKTKMQRRKDIASPLSEFLGICILIVVLLYGGSLVLNEQYLSPGMFITYIATFSQIINPSKSLSVAYYNVHKGVATLERLNEILEAPLVIEENANCKELVSFEQEIEFKNVSFSYNDSPILKNLNFKVAKGKTLALVGSSGAGKSTIADLIPRFHDATSGEILIDGINIKNYSLNSLRNQISIVTQEPILFNDTIKNNILIGNIHATNDEVEQAAKVANAYQFIVKKEQQFDDNIGDRGSKLSGGEKQRLTIARAIVKNTPILILDEATSSLDTESESLVQDSISKLMLNRTTIIIAHRLSTINNADEIIVLQKGEIVERGTHKELIAFDGFYKKLVEMQELK